MSITTILTKLGLNEKESICYKKLLAGSPMTISELAQSTGLKRTTLYTVVESMKQKDLIIENLHTSILEYSAQPVETFQRTIQDERFALQKKEALLNELREEIKLEGASKEQSDRKIVTISQKKLLAYLYERTETWNQSILKSDTDYVGFQDQIFPKKFSKWVDWFWTLPSSNQMVVRLLTNQSVFEETTMRKRKYNRRIIRYWKEARDITATTWIMGDYVVIMNLRDKPYSLIEIKDATIAESYRQIFEGMWKQIV